MTTRATCPQCPRAACCAMVVIMRTAAAAETATVTTMASRVHPSSRRGDGDGDALSSAVAPGRGPVIVLLSSNAGDFTDRGCGTDRCCHGQSAQQGGAA